MEEEADMINDPVYSRSGFNQKKGPDGSLKVNRTDVIEGKGKEGKTVCHLCKGEHDLDNCTDFKKKSVRAKKDYVFRERLCFACFGKGPRMSKDVQTSSLAKHAGRTIQLVCMRWW